MSLKDYSVASDNFQLHPKDRHHAEFAFPCSCCAYATAPDNFQPCASCDHNANSVRQVDRMTANKLRKESDGFCGYDWMIEEIRSEGRIKTLDERKHK